MNDKLQQLYDLYKQKGIINNTDFNTFSSANDAQKKGLYDLGVKQGLFKSTDYNTFTTAWGGASKEEPLKKRLYRFGFQIGKTYIGFFFQTS